jgi:exonuclease SbcC
MIHRLYLNHCFRHQDTTLTFEAGMTTITGRNEAGKSLIAEMIRYALFGSAALRGKADDYKKLHVEMDFEISGISYEIVRNKRSAVLSREGQPLATGVKEVNATIIDTLGYGLMVFDVANACNQGKVEELSELRPSDRKRMVDQTIGLDVLDGLLSWLAIESNLARKSAEALATALVEPRPPLPPENLPEDPQAALVSYTEQEKQLTLDAHEMMRIIGWIEARPPAPGLAPECSIPESIEELENHQRRRRIEMSRKEGLTRQISDWAPPTMTVEEIQIQWQAWEARRDWEEGNATYPKPPHSCEDLGLFRYRLATAEAFEEIQDLYAKIERMEKDAPACSACGHQEGLDQQKLVDLNARVAPLATFLQPRGDLTLKSPLRLSAIEALERQWLARKDLKLDVFTPIIPPVSTTVLRSEERRHQEATGVAEVRQELATLVVPEDREADLDIRLRFKSQLTSWEATMESYKLYNEEVTKKELRLEELRGSNVHLLHVRGLLQELAQFLKEQGLYEQQLSAYEGLKASVDLKNLRADQLKASHGVISGVKLEVKNLLVPSINKVASQLLSEMTGGERTSVQVDEEFEMFIDGQPIQTLSGSGKAVGNLAIRLAIGRVLTNRVFSVFIADEIDASMDAERAQYTAECLRKLKTSIGQIILITHKDPPADHRHVLGAV